MNRRQLLKLQCLGLGFPSGLLFFLSSDASGIPMTGHLSDKQVLQHGGQPRTYRIYVPKSLQTQPRAAVLLLHGHGSSADELLGVSVRQAPYKLWLSIADREDVLLIVPDGLASPDRQRGWNDARNIPSNPNSNDVDFLLALIDTVAESHRIDFSRLYVTGTSNGGHMALRLAAEVPEKFAAVAAVAAANPDPTFTSPPKHPISVMLMNGTRDRILPYAGGSMIRDRGKVLSTEASIQYWVAHNHCADRPSSMQYPDRSKADGCTASRTTYKNADTNVEVILVRIAGGGHTEPSIQQPYSRIYLAIVGAQNQDIEMADEIWSFFRGKVASSAFGQ